MFLKSCDGNIAGYINLLISVKMLNKINQTYDGCKIASSTVITEQFLTIINRLNTFRQVGVCV
jgi:hypothetical protein